MGLHNPLVLLESHFLVPRLVTSPFSIVLLPVMVQNQLTSINEHELSKPIDLLCKISISFTFCIETFLCMYMCMYMFALEGCAALRVFSTCLLDEYISAETPVCMKRGVS